MVVLLSGWRLCRVLIPSPGRTAGRSGRLVPDRSHLPCPCAGQIDRLSARPGQFTGEVNMLSGRRSLVRIRVAESGSVIEIERRPYLLETSLPGVFAVGEVPAGNVKRVASAVGEGSIAVSFIHRLLAE